MTTRDRHVAGFLYERDFLVGLEGLLCLLAWEGVASWFWLALAETYYFYMVLGPFFPEFDAFFFGVTFGEDVEQAVVFFYAVEAGRD